MKTYKNYFKDEKKLNQEIVNNDKKFLDKWNININLVRENQEDIKIASLYKFNTIEKPEQNKAEKRKSLEAESIFNNFSKQKRDDKESENANIKNTCKQNLKQQLQKSSNSEKLLNDGFKFETKNKIDKSIDFGILVKKSEKSTSLTLNQLPSISNTNSLLVLNDYGTGSDDNVSD